MWEVHYYGSGSVVVKNTKLDHKKYPHFYIYGHYKVSDRERQDIGAYICARLNGKHITNPSKELMDVILRLEQTYMPKFGTALQLPNGTMVAANGPSYDRNPPNLDWRQRNKIADKIRRWLLTRKLYKILIEGKK